ncbi:uncharacterized protein BJ171DRAFT_569249 [Polychytrium aggregatum]|uniref:uncharacterized protein n=1 Tax=Polychytrium aggregatum TaxID=110093 RepID=UPI0022FEDE0D|nr:uncharacterized protein BJ171DRAFT_569249 [Polychytrium aggregatum]KAI9202986.1 hypothetical protein BJ171DRAFT_569249 [Polychytrium aggregatum]
MPAMFAQLQTFMFWWLVPAYATQFIQKAIYFLFFKHPPQPNHRRFQQHARLIYISVVLGYLVYSTVQIERSIDPSYYNYLQVPLDATPAQIKSSYRSLSLQLHPDKVHDPELRAQYEAVYLSIRNGYEVLKEPLTRTAYDKFGDLVKTCTHCKTLRDYTVASLASFYYFYVVTAFVLLVMMVLGKGEYGKYWRFVGLFALGVLEYQTIVSPAGQEPLGWLFTWRTPHQKLVLFHQLYISLCIAVSQIGPLLAPVNMPPSQDKEVEILTNQVLELEKLTNMELKEVGSYLQTVLEPYKDHPAEAGVLRRKMEKLMVDSAILETNSDYRSAYEAASKRFRGPGS